MIRWFNRLRVGYDQDLDERAQLIGLLAYRDALATALLLALALPALAPLMERIPLVHALWMFLPLAVILLGLLTGQLVRVARGGVTARVALVTVVALALLIVVAFLSHWLVFDLTK